MMRYGRVAWRSKEFFGSQRFLVFTKLCMWNSETHLVNPKPRYSDWGSLTKFDLPRPLWVLILHLNGWGTKNWPNAINNLPQASDNLWQSRVISWVGRVAKESKDPLSMKVWENIGIREEARTFFTTWPCCFPAFLWLFWCRYFGVDWSDAWPIHWHFHGNSRSNFQHFRGRNLLPLPAAWPAFWNLWSW